MSVVGVCGFGRCGSTMVMRMLDAGGLPPCAGSSPGSFELNGIDGLAERTDLDGHAVKVLDLFAYHPLPDADWRFVWLDRDHQQQARSMIKFAGALTGMSVPVDVLARSYAEDRPGRLGWLRSRGPVCVLSYERVLANPMRAARTMRSEVWPDLDVAAAAAVVHDRTPECRPDLSVELALARGAR